VLTCVLPWLDLNAKRLCIEGRCVDQEPSNKAGVLTCVLPWLDLNAQRLCIEGRCVDQDPSNKAGQGIESRPVKEMESNAASLLLYDHSYIY